MGLVSEDAVAVDSGTVQLVASFMRLSVDAARELLEFRARAVLTFEVLRAALGDACGEFWFLDRRLQVGVAASGDPPAGVHVEAAKQVLERYRLSSGLIWWPVGRAPRRWLRRRIAWRRC